MRNFWVLLFSISFGLLFFNCNSSDRRGDSNPTDLKFDQVDGLSPENTAISVFGGKPNFAFFKEYQRNMYLITFVENKFFVLKEFASTWVPVFDSYPGGSFNSETEPELFMENNDLYFYFLTLDPGNVYGTALFNLYSFNDNRIYAISAFGIEGNYNQITIPSELKAGRNNLLGYLEEKIAASGFINLPDEDDFDFSKPVNAAREWQIENRGVYDLLQTNPNSWFPLKTRSFRVKSINDFFPEPEGDYNYESSGDVFENENYIVTIFFMDPLFVYNKRTLETTLLVGPEWIKHWFTHVEFISPNAIFVKDIRGDSYNINLATNEIKMDETNFQ